MACSDEVAGPCLAGAFRPVLLLPDREVAAADDLRAILAHELAHAKNGDLAWNLAAHVASIILWFHPLAWRIRSAHATACDAVSDAIAADHLGDVVSYGRTLARLAIGAAGPSAPAGVLAMARTSDVRRRLDALERRVFGGSLEWRRVVPALIVLAGLSTLVGGTGFTRAQTRPADEPPAPAPRSSGKLVVHTVAAETGQPVEGVAIEYRTRFASKETTTVRTGEDGRATVEYPPDVRIAYFEITARKAGLVPVCIVWDDRQHPVVMPATKELRFETATAIGGVVRDEGGRPIAGALVALCGRPTEIESMHRVFTLGSVESDAQGRWRLDVAPRDLGGVSVHASHPGYRRAPGESVSRHLDNTIVLTKGLTVTGRVVNAAGRPVAGTAVRLGTIFGVSVPTAKTDGRGAFALENCELGATTVTVQADGHAPAIVDVQVAATTAPVIVTLSEPAATLRGRIVDVEGRPVAGAIIGSDTWRGHRSLEFRATAGADGRFEWRSAPRDVVVYDAFKPGYMSTRQVPLTAGEREHVITLNPELVITGQVTDAATGKPVPSFRLVLGQKYGVRPATTWSENEAVVITGGRYTTRFAEPCEAFYVRVEAPGYEPAESAHLPFKRADADVRLRPPQGRRDLRGRGAPRRPPRRRRRGRDGDRARGVPDAHGAIRSHGELPDGADGPRRPVLLRPEGRPVPGRRRQRRRLCRRIAGRAGEVGQADPAPWGKIEGEVRIGGLPGAGVEVVYQPALGQRGGRWYGLDYSYRATTDQWGRFAFDRAVPARGSVYRSLNQNTEWGWQQDVNVEPGRPARVRIGGTGRAVIGRLVVDGQPAGRVDWTAPAARGHPGREPHAPVRRTVRQGGAIPRRGRPAGEVSARVRIERLDGPSPGRRPLDRLEDA